MNFFLAVTGGAVAWTAGVLAGAEAIPILGALALCCLGGALIGVGVGRAEEGR